MKSHMQKKEFFPLEEVTKIDADFDKIINEQKIKFEDAFYGRIFLFSGVLEILCQSDRIYNSKGLNNESNT